MPIFDALFNVRSYIPTFLKKLSHLKYHEEQRSCTFLNCDHALHTRVFIKIDILNKGVALLLVPCACKRCMSCSVRYQQTVFLDPNSSNRFQLYHYLLPTIDNNFAKYLFDIDNFIMNKTI